MFFFYSLYLRYFQTRKPSFHIRQLHGLLVQEIVSDLYMYSSIFYFLIGFIRGLTHSEITQLGFIRTLARFFLDTRIKNTNDINIANFTAENTIDSLYRLAYPQWNWAQVKLYSFSLKRIIDLIQLENVKIDLFPSTKNLPSAHFDAELFSDSNRRIMELRRQGKLFFQ